MDKKKIKELVDRRVEEEKKAHPKVEPEKELWDWASEKGFTKEFLQGGIKTGRILVQTHNKKECLFIRYFTASGVPVAGQFIPLDGTAPSFDISPEWKEKKEPFFAQPGPFINDAKQIVIVIDPMDALAGYQECPDFSWAALGEAKFIGKEKISIIKTYQDKGVGVILAFSNDPTGKKIKNRFIKSLGKGIKSIEWKKEDPPDCCLSKLLKDGHGDKIKELIENAVPVNGEKKELLFSGIDPDKPTIIFGSDQLDCVTKNAIEVLRNIPDKFFNQCNMGPVSITKQHSVHEGFSITPLTRLLVRYYLAKHANCCRFKKEDEVASVTPPNEVCENIMALNQAGDENSFQPLNGKKESPYYYRSQNKQKIRLHNTLGYNQDSQYFLSNNYFEATPIDTPSDTDVENARYLIYELLDGFPFTSQAERANTIGAFLSVPARLLINGPVPLFLIVADQPGTGKTLLAQTIGWIFLGRDISCISEGDNYAEWGKILLSALMPSPSLLLIDNITRKLDSPDLAMALTSLVFEGRRLGRSEMAKIQISVTPIATANNPRLSCEMARRVVKIGLNSGQDRPQERGAETFAHPNLREWAYKERMNLLKAFLTLIQNWIAKGCPRSKKNLGSFEEWAQIIGGILETNGIDGFLDNLKETFSEFDDEGEVLRTFVSSWYYAFGSGSVGVSDLHNIVISEDIPLPLGDKSERSQKIILGKYLIRLKNRRVDIMTEGPSGQSESTGLKIVAGRTISRIQQWQLSYCQKSDDINK